MEIRGVSCDRFTAFRVISRFLEWRGNNKLGKILQTIRGLQKIGWTQEIIWENLWREASEKNKRWIQGLRVYC